MRTTDIYGPGAVLSAGPTSRRYQLEGGGLGAYSACRLLERLFDWQVPRVPVIGRHFASIAFFCESTPSKERGQDIYLHDTIFVYYCDVVTLITIVRLVLVIFMASFKSENL